MKILMYTKTREIKHPQNLKYLKNLNFIIVLLSMFILNQTVQQQLLMQTATDQTAEGNEEALITEERLLQLKRR